MCTAILSIDPNAADPVLLVGVRDEFPDRPWQPPAAWWPDRYPGLLGGRDLQAGGTWLALDPAARRLACVLNAHGVAAPEPGRGSRGVLPLAAASGAWRHDPVGPGGPDADGRWSEARLTAYDPFHLVVAETAAEDGAVSAWLSSWDGVRLRVRPLGPGLHVIVNSGLEGADDDQGPGRDRMAARVAHFRPRFAAARPAGTGAEGWGGWLELADGGGLDPTDPRALLVKQTLADGRVWGTSSVSLVALGSGSGFGSGSGSGSERESGAEDGRARVRYDFNGTPGDRTGWRRVS